MQKNWKERDGNWEGERERNPGAVGSKWLLCPNGRLKARKWMRSGRQSMGEE